MHFFGIAGGLREASKVFDSVASGFIGVAPGVFEGVASGFIGVTGGLDSMTGGLERGVG